MLTPNSHLPAMTFLLLPVFSLWNSSFFCFCLRVNSLFSLFRAGSFPTTHIIPATVRQCAPPSFLRVPLRILILFHFPRLFFVRLTITHGFEAAPAQARRLISPGMTTQSLSFQRRQHYTHPLVTHRALTPLFFVYHTDLAHAVCPLTVLAPYRSATPIPYLRSYIPSPTSLAVPCVRAVTPPRAPVLLHHCWMGIEELNPSLDFSGPSLNFSRSWCVLSKSSPPPLPSRFQATRVGYR